MTSLCKKFIVVKSKEMKTGSDLAEGNDSKRAGLPIMMTHGINQKMVLTHDSITHVSISHFLYL
jgi:hypothetical protein